MKKLSDMTDEELLVLHNPASSLTDKELIQLAIKNVQSEDSKKTMALLQKFSKDIQLLSDKIDNSLVPMDENIIPILKEIRYNQDNVAKKRNWAFDIVRDSTGEMTQIIAKEL